MGGGLKGCHMIGVLPDVETWKDYFNSRKTSRHRHKINKAFELDRVYTTGLIITQLISSFPIDNIETISRVIKGLKIIEVSTDDYIWAGKISAYMREMDTPLIPSSVILHHRLSDIHQLEYLTANFKDESISIKQSLIECCQKESNLFHFMYTTSNNKNYLGTGYRDKLKAVKFDQDPETVFSFDENIYIYKKYMNKIKEEVLNKSITASQVFSFDGDKLALTSNDWKCIKKILEY